MFSDNCHYFPKKYNTNTSSTGSDESNRRSDEWMYTFDLHPIEVQTSSFMIRSNY